MNDHELERRLRPLLAPLAPDPDPEPARSALLARLDSPPRGAATHSPGRHSPGRRSPGRRSPRRHWLAVAAAAGALLGLGALFLRGPSYAVELQVAGATEATRLSADAALELAADAHARVEVPGFGHLEVEPGSRVRVARHRGARHAFHLERGAVRANIFAAPRAFQLGTPSGIAVDLGCVYRTVVDGNGAARVEVESGRVAFETEQREVTVPAGAYVEASVGRVGSPLWSDAPAAFVDFVRGLDAGETMAADVVRSGLDAARPRDAWTLLHVLDHDLGDVQADLLDTLLELVPPPPWVQLERAFRRGPDRDLWLSEVLSVTGLR